MFVLYNGFSDKVCELSHFQTLFFLALASLETVLIFIVVAPPPPPLPKSSEKKKVDPKQLIQQKLMELKRKAREEAETNAAQRKDADKLNIAVKPRDGGNSTRYFLLYVLSSLF